VKVRLSETCTEAELQEAVRSAALMGGWRFYHTHDSRRSPAGFPDLVLLHPKRRLLLFVELKSATGRLSLDQADWLDCLGEIGQDCGRVYAEVWRPADLDRAIALLVGRG